MKTETKAAPLSFRVKPKIKEEMERIARERNQSVASLIELACLQLIEREGKRKSRV
jgi:predicted transcriptional regulator